MRSSLASVATLLAALQPAIAATHYGCWSDQSAIFHDDCISAVVKIVTRFAITPNARQAMMPSSLETEVQGRCRVQIKAKSAMRVNIGDLLISFDQLISRCQNGYFYYDNGFNANVQGHAGWKRNEANAVNQDGIDFPHGGLSEWKTPEEPLFLPPLADSLEESHTSSKRQHVKELVARAAPSGQRIINTRSRGIYYTLYRTVDKSIHGLTRVAPGLTQFFSSRARDMISDALAVTNNIERRTSLAYNQRNEQAHAIGVAIKISNGKRSWQQLFNGWGDSGDSAADLLDEALSDFYNNGYTSAVYTIWNERSEELVTYVLNRVVGLTTPFPRPAPI